MGDSAEVPRDQTGCLSIERSLCRSYDEWGALAYLLAKLLVQCDTPLGCSLLMHAYCYLRAQPLALPSVEGVKAQFLGSEGAGREGPGRPGAGARQAGERGQ